MEISIGQRSDKECVEEIVMKGTFDVAMCKEMDIVNKPILNQKKEKKDGFKEEKHWHYS